MTEWQSIETAPKDEVVLVCGCGYRGYYVSDAKLIDGTWYLFDPLEDGYLADSEGHTHWMPIPAPPVEQAKTEVEG
jgi:hypothetical protein